MEKKYFFFQKRAEKLGVSNLLKTCAIDSIDLGDMFQNKPCSKIRSELRDTAPQLLASVKKMDQNPFISAIYSTLRWKVHLLLSLSGSFSMVIPPFYILFEVCFRIWFEVLWLLMNVSKNPHQISLNYETTPWIFREIRVEPGTPTLTLETTKQCECF